jgi:hypothetical protein
MKLLVSALLAAGALCIATLPAVAGPGPVTSCSSESRDAEVPSGTQTDANGRTWVGFKSGGLPPDSLSKSSESVTCVEYEPI